jgi:hypothetical protein
MCPSSNRDEEITNLNALLELFKCPIMGQDEKKRHGSQNLIAHFWPGKAGESPLPSKFAKSSNAHWPKSGEEEHNKSKITNDTQGDELDITRL